MVLKTQYFNCPFTRLKSFKPSTKMLILLYITTKKYMIFWTKITSGGQNLLSFLPPICCHPPKCCFINQIQSAMPSTCPKKIYNSPNSHFAFNTVFQRCQHNFTFQHSFLLIASDTNSIFSTVFQRCQLNFTFQYSFPTIASDANTIFQP